MSERRISLAEPVTELRRVKIAECGEPLVNFMEFCPELIFDKPRYDYRREQLIRKSVAEMLCKAAKALPKGYKLAIIEGWRPPYIQKRMHAAGEARWREAHPEWSDTKIRRVTNQFTAPMNNRVPPPHTTGGAVDLMLALPDGTLCDHISPFKYRDSRAYYFDAKGLSDEARRTRQILADAILPTGLTNYPSEFWHWSYGDQGWAYRGGHPNALYGPVVPDGWQPDPRDNTDAPLKWVYDPAGQEY